MNKVVFVDKYPGGRLFFHVHVKMEDKMIINMSLTWTWKCRCRCRCFRREEKDVARSLSHLRGRTR